MTAAKLRITVSDSILIRATPEDVWDYTQDWRHRPQWDDGVLEVLSQSADLPKRVRAKFRGAGLFDIEYKVYERARRTSLTMQGEGSAWLLGGGGAWTYESKDGGTQWFQSNTVFIKDSFLNRLLVPIVRGSLRRSTRKAMEKARRLIENGARRPQPQPQKRK